MALCEGQLDSVLPQLKRDESPISEGSQKATPEKKAKIEHNGDVYGLNQVPGGLPLSVDFRSPVSHFVPPELYAARHKQEQISTQSSGLPTPIKRKRGRPRVDKTSPEYLANLAARKQAKEMAAVMNNRTPDSGEKRKRGRPRVDKTSPEYLARKKARELEALERKAKREYKRRTTGDSAASSSAGENTPRVKRKYTKRTPNPKKDASTSSERVKGKRGRPRKSDQLAAGNKQQQQPKIRVRNNLMPMNAEPITLDSDDEPDLGSPSQASDSLSLDENLRALRHIHEKYANIDKDDLYEAHLLAANFKKPLDSQRRDDDEVLSIRSSEGCASVKELDARVEKLEDSSNSDSDSSSSGSGSSSSGSSSSSSSGSSSSSDSSDSESEPEDKPKTEPPPANHHNDDDRSFGAWSYSGPASGSASDSDPERQPPASGTGAASHDEISESDNESADKSFQCHVCSKWYSTRVTLKIHRRVHQNRGGGNSRSRARSSDRYECDCCSETFNRREKLWEHKAEAHRGAMTVRCEVCRKCFEDDAELAEHDLTHTADERAGRCPSCGLSFPRYEQLRRHMACAHGAAPAAAAARLPHACKQCGKRFSHAHSLTRHMHNHAKQLYRCVVCKASFARADQLAQHLNSHLANYKRLKP
ncbi:zinc finger protein 37-like isoform X2 [Trichoplusia ni]|uniref:Zinc finger protein 37-like isoform X2 n=1 Tax=Trichoplusia ni TaxID=7111 RepID=A0A7E5X3Q2_TRINI|nr:zinc finger protein 37-like isoform X2 [Trichoplusia ni]